jgi:predicted aspartyl protease
VVMMNGLPLICAALVSGAGDPAGVQALRAAAWNRLDAAPRLEAFLETAPRNDPNRLAALVSLRELSMGAADYRQAHAWNQQAFELAGRTLPHLSDELLDAASQINRTRDDVLAIDWGLIGLPRVDARFGMTRVSALVDTGAEYAVISESLARRAGLTPLQDGLPIGGSAGRLVHAGITLAEITLGQSTFSNAAVLIVPDDALAFPMGLRIDAIIGMPQLRAFAAVEFSPQSLRLLTTIPAEDSFEPNIAFDGWRLMSPALIDGEQVWMQIDTGARRSIRYNQTDASASGDGTIIARGLGGARRVRGESGRATMEMAGRSVTVRELQRRVPERPSEGCSAPGPRSLLGQDMLRHRAFRINFTTMRLEWMP